MSVVVFKFEIKRVCLANQKVMPAKDVLNLVEGVLTYSFEEAMLGRSLKDFPAMMCIRYGKSCLPIILRYLDQEHAYHVYSLKILQPLKIGDSS